LVITEIDWGVSYQRSVGFGADRRGAGFVIAGFIIARRFNLYGRQGDFFFSAACTLVGRSAAIAMPFNAAPSGNNAASR